MAFRDAESYCSTLAHERPTGRSTRPASTGTSAAGNSATRGTPAKNWSPRSGPRSLCCDLGITPEPRDDHAAYLGHWLNVLKADQRAIFQAASHAQRAVDFLHGLQPGGSLTPAQVQGEQP